MTNNQLLAFILIFMAAVPCLVYGGTYFVLWLGGLI